MSEYMHDCMWCGLLRQPYLIQVFETELWRVFLAPEQTYLGKSIAVLREHAPAQELSKTAMEDLSVAADRLYMRTRAEFFARRVETMEPGAGLLAIHANVELCPRYDGEAVEIPRAKDDNLVFTDPRIDPAKHPAQTTVSRDIQEIIALKLWPSLAVL